MKHLYNYGFILRMQKIGIGSYLDGWMLNFFCMRLCLIVSYLELTNWLNSMLYFGRLFMLFSPKWYWLQVWERMYEYLLCLPRKCLGNYLNIYLKNIVFSSRKFACIYVNLNYLDCFLIFRYIKALYLINSLHWVWSIFLCSRHVLSEEVIIIVLSCRNNSSNKKIFIFTKELNCNPRFR